MVTPLLVLVVLLTAVLVYGSIMLRRSRAILTPVPSKLRPLPLRVPSVID
jgi:hypothetical protein